MIFPKALRQGDTVGLIAPGSPVSQKELEQCIRMVQALGYQVKIGGALTGGGMPFYLSGAAEVRAGDVNSMFRDDGVAAVFCVRGGYGSSQILEYLDYEMIRAHPKILLGYSDVTALHGALQRHCGLVTLHGPMVKSNLIHGFDDYSRKSLCRAFEMKYPMDFRNPPGEEFVTIRPGAAQGTLVGGNLAVLARSCGTAYQPRTKGGILFLEDIGENLPRLHMYMTQLRLSGMFEDVQGFLLGGFLSEEGSNGQGCPGEERADWQTAQKQYQGKVYEIIQEELTGLSVPILGNVCCDHRHPMGTLPLGAECILDARHGVNCHELSHSSLKFV